MIATDAVRQVTLTEEERSEGAEQTSPDQAPEPTGQMVKIREAVEALLKQGERMSMRTPTQAWRRITDHLHGVGIHAREIPHRSTYNRFRKKFGSMYGLR